MISKTIILHPGSVTSCLTLGKLLNIHASVFFLKNGDITYEFIGLF